MLRVLAAALVAVLAAGACHGNEPASATALEGAWRVERIVYFTSRGEFPIDSPQPGLFIFGESYYSMVWMPLEQAALDSKEIWRPTDAEKIRSWNMLVVNSGTYAATDSTVTTYPLVAKTPEFVGGSATYTYRVSGDTLHMEMIDTLAHDGTRDPGVGVVRIPMRLLRVE